MWNENGFPDFSFSFFLSFSYFRQFWGHGKRGKIDHKKRQKNFHFAYNKLFTCYRLFGHQIVLQWGPTESRPEGWSEKRRATLRMGLSRNWNFFMLEEEMRSFLFVSVQLFCLLPFRKKPFPLNQLQSEALCFLKPSRAYTTVEWIAEKLSICPSEWDWEMKANASLPHEELVINAMGESGVENFLFGNLFSCFSFGFGWRGEEKCFSWYMRSGVMQLQRWSGMDFCYCRRAPVDFFSPSWRNLRWKPRCDCLRILEIFRSVRFVNRKRARIWWEPKFRNNDQLRRKFNELFPRSFQSDCAKSTAKST